MGLNKRYLEDLYFEDLQKKHLDDEYHYWFYKSKNLSVDEIIENTIPLK